LPCAPCWKKACDMPHGPICVTAFKPEWIVNAVREIYHTLNSGYTKAPAANELLVSSEFIL
ncbi:MAG: hypothetical protein ONA90_08910, partial [candidate division KSB1 bacterium]|nr:hypothetical protein [candidate division KSB1 bacterium]